MRVADPQRAEGAQAERAVEVEVLPRDLEVLREALDVFGGRIVHELLGHGVEAHVLAAVELRRVVVVVVVAVARLDRHEPQLAAVEVDQEVGAVHRRLRRRSRQRPQARGTPPARSALLIELLVVHGSSDSILPHEGVVAGCR